MLLKPESLSIVARKEATSSGRDPVRDVLPTPNLENAGG